MSILLKIDQPNTVFGGCSEDDPNIKEERKERKGQEVKGNEEDREWWS